MSRDVLIDEGIDKPYRLNIRVNCSVLSKDIKPWDALGNLNISVLSLGSFSSVKFYLSQIYPRTHTKNGSTLSIKLPQRRSPWQPWKRPNETDLDFITWHCVPKTNIKIDIFSFVSFGRRRSRGCTKRASGKACSLTRRRHAQRGGGEIIKFIHR